MRKPATTLRIVTMPNQPELATNGCEGTYTCECSGCVADRAKLVKLGVRRTRPAHRSPRAA